MCRRIRRDRDRDRDRDRGDARFSTRRLQCHQREVPMESHSVPRGISVSGEEGDSCVVRIYRNLEETTASQHHPSTTKNTISRNTVALNTAEFIHCLEDEVNAPIWVNVNYLDPLPTPAQLGLDQVSDSKHPPGRCLGKLFPVVWKTGEYARQTSQSRVLKWALTRSKTELRTKGGQCCQNGPRHPQGATAGSPWGASEPACV